MKTGLHPSSAPRATVPAVLKAFLVVVGTWGLAADSHEPPLRGAEFIRLDSLATFTVEQGHHWVSPPITASIEWDQLVPSWNVSSNAAFQLSIRVVYPERKTGFYSMGEWALHTNAAPRASVPGQHDDDGEVRTDILQLRRPAKSFQVRLAFTREEGHRDVTSLGFAVVDTRIRPLALESSRSAWGRTLEVPVRSQLDYPEGASRWCSPASLTMLLAWWAKQLDRPELDFSIPSVAAAVYDPQWPGTGNWPFNTAFASAQPGLRACVTRLSDITELEWLIDAGIPAAASVSYRLLKGQPQREGVDGHLVVVVGFTSTGDVNLNDPGVELRQVRRTIPRESFRRAWASSHNTIYLTWPAEGRLPTNPLRHW